MLYGFEIVVDEKENRIQQQVGFGCGKSEMLNFTIIDLFSVRCVRCILIRVFFFSKTIVRANAIT